MLHCLVTVRQYFVKTIRKNVHWKYTPTACGKLPTLLINSDIFFPCTDVQKKFTDKEFHYSCQVEQGSLPGTERLRYVSPVETILENRGVKCPFVWANLTGVWISLPSSVCCRCAQNSDGRKSIRWSELWGKTHYPEHQIEHFHASENKLAFKQDRAYKCCTWMT